MSQLLLFFLLFLKLFFVQNGGASRWKVWKIADVEASLPQCTFYFSVIIVESCGES